MRRGGGGHVEISAYFWGIDILHVGYHHIFSFVAYTVIQLSNFSQMETYLCGWKETVNFFDLHPWLNSILKFEKNGNLNKRNSMSFNIL